MTENKRFTVKQRQGATIYSIIDYYGELPLSEGMYYKSNAEKLCKWLNTQHELLNTLYNENEQLKKVLGAILLEVKRDISNTNQTGEIKVFINPNSFDLISEVLKKYGALKEWYNE